MMPIRLNRKLVLEAPQNTPDGAGGFVAGWQVLGEIWADVRARTGRERQGEEVPVSVVGYRIILRGAPDGASNRPQPEQRFRDGTRIFRITAVTEHDADARYLTCYAEEEVAA